MTTEEKENKVLFIIFVMMVTFLIFGSFVVSYNILDLIYLITFYVIIITSIILKKKK